jgi:hypothetical protein
MDKFIIMNVHDVTWNKPHKWSFIFSSFFLCLKKIDFKNIIIIIIMKNYQYFKLFLNFKTWFITFVNLFSYKFMFKYLSRWISNFILKNQINECIINNDNNNDINDFF